MPLTTIVNSTFPVLLQLFQVSSSCPALPRPALLCAHRCQFSSSPISHLPGALPVRLLLLQIHFQRSSLQLHRHSSAANLMGFFFARRGCWRHRAQRWRRQSCRSWC